MRHLALVLGVFVAVGALAVGPGAPAIAEPVYPVFHEETGRLLGEVTEQLRGLGAQVQQHLQHGPGAPGAIVPGGPGFSAAERPLITLMLQHRTDLGLTPEQVARLDALRNDFQREAIRREAEIRITELDLAALLEQEPLELARVEAKIRAVAQLRADLRIARLRTIEQGKAVLTAEQRARLLGLLGAAPAGMPGRARAAGAVTRL